MQVHVECPSVMGNPTKVVLFKSRDMMTTCHVKATVVSDCNDFILNPISTSHSQRWRNKLCVNVSIHEHVELKSDKYILLSFGKNHSFYENLTEL